MRSRLNCRKALLVSWFRVYKRSKNYFFTNSWYSVLSIQQKQNKQITTKWKSHASSFLFSLQWHLQQFLWTWQKLAKNTSRPFESCISNHKLVLTSKWLPKICDWLVMCLLVEELAVLHFLKEFHRNQPLSLHHAKDFSKEAKAPFACNFN